MHCKCSDKVWWFVAGRNWHFQFGQRLKWWFNFTLFSIMFFVSLFFFWHFRPSKRPKSCSKTSQRLWVCRSHRMSKLKRITDNKSKYHGYLFNFGDEHTHTQTDCNSYRFLISFYASMEKVMTKLLHALSVSVLLSGNFRPCFCCRDKVISAKRKMERRKEHQNEKKWKEMMKREQENK